MSDEQAKTGSLNDVNTLLTELERIQSKLDQFQDAISQSHRLSNLGTIATIIAHEFNNILTPVVSYCQLAQQSPDDIELLRKAVTKSLAGAEKAAQISSSLLGFAADHASEDHCDVNSIVHEVLNCLAREPKKDGIQLRLEIEDHCDVAVQPIALQQILLNLILNARQAMSYRGGSLTISAREESGRVSICVADTGPGIPEDLLPHIFEPFVTQRSGGEKGTGLGLAICHQLVSKHDGRIEVDSTPGQGTTFTIDLPAYSDSANHAA